jgi:integrase
MLHIPLRQEFAARKASAFGRAERSCSARGTSIRLGLLLWWCRDEHKLSSKTISTYLSYVKAGLRFCSRPHLVKDARGRQREVQILSGAPHINDSEDHVVNETKLPRSEPRKWRPTDAQLAAIFDAIEPGREDHEAIFRYMIMALNTWARPEAITQLSVKDQVNFQEGIVLLNPPGRAQNKKRRPQIRLTDNLRGWLLYWNLDKPITYFGRSVGRVDNRTLKKLAGKAGVDPTHVNRYMLRHYMATRIRRVAGIPVPREQRAASMGHSDPKHKQTEWYEAFDPDHLEEAMRATDEVMAALNQLCQRRKLVAPTVANTTLRLSIVQGGKMEASGS